MKIKHILPMGLLLSTAVLAGCSEDFLNVDSKTQAPASEYYQDSLHIGQSLVSAYSPLEWNDWNGKQYNPQNIMSDIMADDIWPGGASKMDNQYWHLMMNYEALPTNCMTGIWDNMATGVKRCNDLLAYADAYKDHLSAATYNNWTAQAHVLRDYYYMMWWKFYGNIPYHETNTDEYKYPQLKADEVYTNVITDLEKTIDMKALPMYWDEDNLGRVSQAMAYMVYAEMVMYQNDESRYAKALGYMEEIINNGHYALDPSYAHIFEADGEWSSESIFEIDYTDNKSFRGWGSSDAIIAGGTVLPRVISCPKAIPALGTDDGWGFAPVRTSTYEMFAANDARRDVSCLDVRSYNEADPDFKPRYQNTGFWIGKYVAYSKNVERATGDKQLNYNNNLRIYRFAETLLNAAELIVRTNGDLAKARTYLNMVRKRAGLGTEVEPTIDNIINERHLEFVGEGKRYWDLVRTGKAATTLVPDDFGYRTNKWTENKKYLPIPQTEMAADPNLVQNPY